ncbi:MAG: hemolysin family protein [Anaerolineales bacterium]
MSSIGLEAVLILLLILANGVFALAEIAIISARKTRLQQRANQGDRGAKVALELMREPQHFLSTVQIGITLVGILAGAFGGATFAETLAVWFATFPLLAPYSEAIGIAIVVLLITYVSLVLGELLPKRLALNNPERIAAAMAAPMRFLSVLMAPIVQLLSTSTEALLKVLNIPVTDEAPITQEEIKLLIDQGVRIGVFVHTEKEMVDSALRLGDQRVSSLITPRPELVWIDRDDSLDHIQEIIINSLHAYFPVVQGSLDNVIGILRGRDLLAGQVAGKPVDLGKLVRPPLFVPESQSVLAVLEQFKQTGHHMAVVIDEFGGLQGIVTLTDVLEALVGDIRAPGQPQQDSAVRREDGSWLLDGRLLLHEFKSLIDLSEDWDEPSGFETLGGFIMDRLGRIPSPSEHFIFGGFRFEVVDMDGRRVDKVLATPYDLQTPPPKDEPDDI